MEESVGRRRNLDRAQGAALVLGLLGVAISGAFAASLLTLDDGATVRLVVLDDGRVGVGTSSPAADALLELSSTSTPRRGFLPPRVTTLERDAIDNGGGSPSVGNLVYNTDTNTFNFWDGTAWQSLQKVGAGGSAPDGLGPAADGQSTGVVHGAAGPPQLANAYTYSGAHTDIGTSTSQFNFLHDSATMKWTIAVWIKFHAVGDRNIIIDTSDVRSNLVGMSLRTASNNRLELIINEGTGASVITAQTANGAIPDITAWHFYVLTYDHALGADNLTLWRDGAVLERFTKSGSAPSPADAAYRARIGWGANGNDNRMNADLDELSIWSRVLTGQEISDLHASGSGAPATSLADRSGLKVSWTFDESSGDLINAAIP